MINIKKSYLSILLFAFFVTGCVYHHPEPKEVKDELKTAMNLSDKIEIPEDVLNELNPDNPLDGDYSAKDIRRVTVAANNVPAAEFFAQIMGETNESVVVHPEVSGEITLSMENVTASEIFNSVYKMYGYRTEKQGSIYYVYPSGVHTETIPINYIFLKRASETNISISNNTVSNTNSDSSSNSDSSNSSSNNSSNDSSSGSDSESTSGTNLKTTAESDFWTELEKTLSGIVGNGEGRMVRVNPQAANITVRGMPNEIDSVRHFLQITENSLRRQVIIEAKLLEVTLSEDYEQGIEWSKIFNGNSGEGKSIGTQAGWAGGSTNNVFSILGGGFNLSMNDSKYSAVINLLKTQGDVSTLSSPRITALNNQRAVIKVGKDSYFLTGLSTDSSSTSSSDTNLVSSDYTFSPFFSGVSLDVLPQISEDGKIILHIHPAVIEVAEDKKTIKINNKDTELPFASSEIRESDTIVEAKSGDVIVIGGLMSHKKGDLESKIPLLGDIPWVGELFTNKSIYDKKSELVILLRPIVAEGDSWNTELKKSLDLLQKWYPNEDSTITEPMHNSDKK
jgi:MSHA biogenesis protein MshL